MVVSKEMKALYFSRSIIPYQRNRDKKEWLAGHTYYKHIGLYAYRAPVLKEITPLPQSSLELAESLEQLRWLENGYKDRRGRYRCRDHRHRHARRSGEGRSLPDQAWKMKSRESKPGCLAAALPGLCLNS